MKFLYLILVCLIVFTTIGVRKYSVLTGYFHSSISFIHLKRLQVDVYLLRKFFSEAQSADGHSPVEGSGISSNQSGGSTPAETAGQGTGRAKGVTKWFWQ